MTRVRALVLTIAAASLAGGGCGSYDARLDRTVKRLQERARLDQYLNPPAEGKYKEEAVYLRSPKPLPQQGADFRLNPSVGDDQYDLRSSFVASKPDGGLTLGLHVLGRHKKPKRPDPKGAAPAAEPQRGDFTQDVLAVLNAVHGGAAGGAAPKKVRQKGNEYNRLVYGAGENTIQAYLLSRKFGQEVYEVALIWEVPPDGLKTFGTPIDLGLQTLALGPAAAKLFQGGEDDDDAAGGEGPSTAF